MTEGECGDHETRHDLVADAEIERGVEHLVRQADGGAQRNHVARKQRQLHARFALRHAIAHSRDATGDLCHGTEIAGGGADEFREALIGLMRREHVVIGGDDADIGRIALGEFGLVAGAAGGKAMREIGATELLARRLFFRCLGDPLKIAATTVMAAFDDPFGDFADPRMNGHGLCPFSNNLRF